MKILSLNLHHHFEIDIYKKMELVADYIYSNNIDLVAFQEVGQCVYMPILKDNIRYGNYAIVINDILNMKYGVDYLVYNNIYKKAYDGLYEEGSAILSKTKVAVEEVLLSNNSGYDNWEKRVAQVVKTGNVTLANVHFGWTTETENFMDQFANLPKDVNFIIGDFNHEVNSKEYYYVAKEYKDLISNYNQKYNTVNTFLFDNANPLKNTRIDFAFGNSHKVVDFKYVFEKFEVSDHKGIYIEIE